MMDQNTLDTCLSITGSFENGKPTYTAVTGNFDGQGLSVGLLQWCAGQGSLGALIQEMVDLSSADFVDGFFDTKVTHLCGLDGGSAIQFVKAAFLDRRGKPTPTAITQWGSLLGSETGVQAQVNLALQGPLARAHSLAEKFCPGQEENLRVIAFFFDLVTQSGSMKNSRGAVSPITLEDVDTQEVFHYMETSNTQFYNVACQEEVDDLTHWLLYYAYERAKLSKAEYMWDAFSRRATIAARRGVVHGKVFDLTSVLP